MFLDQEKIFDTIEDAIEDFKAGKMIIVVDDEDRENEGDLVMAAEMATPEAINFMATYGRGLICVSLTAERLKKLDLDQMVQNNTDPRGTAFTVSVDAINSTTGISAYERANTIQVLVTTLTVSRTIFISPATFFLSRPKKAEF